ncbi:MAG: fibronectin type III domain-containing protein, partial [Bifidobacterium sp.]|nr:fibronectin type III domain-containing protein [Bifidobacterium sp.]
FPDTPLRLVGLVSDDTSRLTATNLGDGRIAIKADRDIGASTNTILATVEDGSLDPGRRVSATITVGIIDRPQAPRMLAGAAQAGDGTVILAWEPGAVNGSPVDEYRVSYTSSAGSGQRSCGNAVTCRIDGLANGHDYSFTVQAHNQVGWSPASSPAAARPDVLPGGVQGLTVDGGSKETLTVTWRPPENHGSPIQGYTVHGDGSGCGSPRWRSATSTKAVFDVGHDEAGGTCTVSVTPANMAGSGPVASASGATWSHPDPPAFQTLEYQGKNQVKLTLNPGAEHGRPCADIQVSIDGLDPDKASWTLPCNQPEVSEVITLPAGSAKPGATLNFRAVARIRGVGSEGHSPAATKELTLPKDADKPSDKTLNPSGVPSADKDE